MVRAPGGLRMMGSAGVMGSGMVLEQVRVPGLVTVVVVLVGVAMELEVVLVEMEVALVVEVVAPVAALIVGRRSLVTEIVMAKQRHVDTENMSIMCF